MLRLSDDLQVGKAGEYLVCFDLIMKENDERIRKILMFWFSSIYSRSHRLNRYMPSHNRHVGPLSGTLYVPFFQAEINIIGLLEDKLKAIQSISGMKDGNVIVTNQSTTDFKNVPESSVDYIFTDPPFGDNLNYSELNIIWESWLKIKTNSNDEAVINGVQGKSLIDYQNLMSKCFEQYYRVLKPNRWMTVEFHNSKNAVWNAIQESIQKAGFVIADVRTLDKQKGTTKQHISAFANADGGSLVIGISDKKRKLEGINSCGDDKINEFINAPKDCCRPMPKYKEEIIDITNDAGKPDRLLILHIEPCVDQVIRTSSDRTYLRIGDKSKEMLGDNLRNLEYAKGTRHFEDEIHPLASYEDLDEELIEAYKSRIGAYETDPHQVLAARGFIQKKDDEEHITNAAVLLFAKNMLKFNMNCRIRFIRVDGREMLAGDKYNVVKDKSIDEPILRLVDAAKDYIADQLRVFTRQEHGSGKFIENPEYPEFPWLEGIINAVAHRDWSASGQYILVSMYDDRLEIESPGKLPDVVTVDNIAYTRFSRNKTISRVMTEFKWVRELNEGVKKIYSDMEDAGLPEPEYKETPNTVKLILRNNIDIRQNKTSNNPSDDVLSDVLHGYEDVWDQLDKLSQAILKYMSKMVEVSRSELEDTTKKSGRTINDRLNKLLEQGLITSNGNKYDPNRTYELARK